MKPLTLRLLTATLTLGVLLALAVPTLAGSGMGTAFTYRGSLTQAGSPYTGQCDFQFGLWDSSLAGIQIGSTQTRSSVAVASGVFDVSMDFGATAFNGQARWLETAVRCPANTGGYTTLSPRQALTPMPYALYALRVDAANINGLAAGTGLTYSGGQFSIGAGAITNTLLANPALTVTAGSGLNGGGSVTLGGSTSLAIAPGGITSTMLAPGAVTAAKIDLSGVQARVTGACPAGQSVQSINADGSVTCTAGLIPAGMIAAFAATSCPAGWSAVTEAQGRVVVGLVPGGTLSGTVGTALGDLVTRTVGLAVANLPPHTHDIDPAPVAASTSSGGTHTHTMSAYDSGGAAGGNPYSRPTDPSVNGFTVTTIATSGAHTHTVTVDVPKTTSTATGGGAAVDVTMPYLQLLMCRKD